jgi:hypothetical protein
VSDMDAVVGRVRRRAFGLAVLATGISFLVGWRAGVSLTIAAAVVIFSFLALEKLLERLAVGQKKPGLRSLWRLSLVAGASLVLLGAVLWEWKGFDPVAGAVGLSVVVLAILPEAWRG